MDSLDQASGPDRYSTLAGGDHRNTLEIKKSRFITVLRRVETESNVRDLVSELRKEFHGAGHHCSAFILGADRSIQRSNDDGEPSGTAGAPMLEALLRRETMPGATDLSDVCAVVVRYFGGTLLGAGGLVRAYSDSVSTALAAAPLVIRQRMQLFTIGLAHADAGRLENELRAENVQILGNHYSSHGVKLTVAVPAGAHDLALPHRIAALTAGRSAAQPVGCEWRDIEPGCRQLPVAADGG